MSKTHIVVVYTSAMRYSAIRVHLRFLLLLSLYLSVPALIVITNPFRGDAHETEISGEVGATLHIEPNDNPQAGIPSLAWFALTRRGGQLISLSECNCQLAVYAQPYQAGDSPIQQPSLTAVSAEGREGVPGAEVNFPSAGAYELVLQGQPVTDGAFDPFELRFSVTVAQ